MESAAGEEPDARAVRAPMSPESRIPVQRAAGSEFNENRFATICRHPPYPK